MRPRGSRTMSIHEWDDRYAEVSIANSLLRAEELAELAHDVGFQLGRAIPA